MRKLHTAKLLMVATILLVVIFQLYWLGKLYYQEYDNLKRTTDVVFRESLYNLQVDRLDKDSSLGGLPRTDLFTKNIIKVMKVNKDSFLNGKKRTVFISTNEASSLFDHDPMILRDTLQKVMVHSDSLGGKLTEKFRIPELLANPIPIESVDSAYKIALVKANIYLPFSIRKSKLEASDSDCPGAFCTSGIPAGIFNQYCYKASFSDPTFFLVNRVKVQALLSLLLIALTILSFVFIYRNLIKEKKLSDIKNEFISNITHELKTPIATVSVAIEAMKNFNALHDPTRTKEYLDIADNELQRLSLLVDKVLKLSMFEQQQIEMNFEKVDLLQVTNEVIASMRIQFEKRKAVVDLVNEGNDFVITGDRLHLTSMLYNLLDNALKYTVDKPLIKVLLKDESSKVKLVITDNGIGIDPQYKDKIFEKFFRVPGGNQHNVKGYGLGLSYVAHILDKHSGNVRAVSENNSGSSFTIELPKNNDQET